MKKKITVWLEDDEGEYEEEIELPAVYEVCDRCRGTGVHDHPAFSNGITAEDFAEDPDFHEDYMRGRYDVPCEVCGGLRVVSVVDKNRLSKGQKEMYDIWLKEQQEIAMERAHERRMRSLGIEY
jgi:hypothetical protein